MQSWCQKNDSKSQKRKNEQSRGVSRRTVVERVVDSIEVDFVFDEDLTDAGLVVLDRDVQVCSFVRGQLVDASSHQQLRKYHELQ